MHIVLPAAYVLLGCCLTIREAVLRRNAVPAHTMENPMSLDKLSLWTATPGERWVSCHFMTFLFGYHASYYFFSFHSTCKNRKWECTDNECDGTCTIYGEGHYITFDDKRFSFNGDCGYVIAQVSCVLSQYSVLFGLVLQN